MMKSSIWIGIAGFLCAMFCGVQKGDAQEQVVPLQTNAHLQNHHKKTDASFRKKKKQSDTLTLPFFDDFSYKGPYPDQSFWADRKVYINSRFGIDPPSYGVATFDGLNDAGLPYNPDQNNNNKGLPTDTLTSNYIDLSGRDVTDDIFLSFFYQPKGKGDEPERVDSLILQLKSSADTNQWSTVWRIGGGKNYDPIPAFQPVILPIDYPDSAGFYHEAFQFRFVSYGNRSGNLDHWHLDYVRLGASRNAGDTTRRDAAVVQPPLGVLEGYHEMPWSQIQESDLRNEISFKARNNYQQTLAVEGGYNIVDLVENQEVAENFTETFQENIDGNYGLYTYNQANLFDLLDFAGRDSVHIRLNAAVTEGNEGLNDEVRANDTFHKELFFQHYFAYDDGTAEGGYGLNSFYDYGKVAQRFSLNNSDTLRAVGIRFTNAKNDISNRTFDLKIWSSLGPLNQPDGREELLATQSDLSPKYNGKGRDGFVIYELEDPVALNGDFYVGWEQFTEYNLRVGLDKGYEDHSGTNGERKIFYNFDGSWQRSATPKTEGAVLMIRPFVGDDSINYYNGVKQNVPEQTTHSEWNVNVYPNPFQDHLKIASETFKRRSSGIEVRVFNTSGKQLHSTILSGGKGELDLTHLKPGLYILQLRNLQNGKRFHKKLIKK